MVRSRRQQLDWFLATAVGWFAGLALGLSVGEVLGRYGNVLLDETVGPIGSSIRDLFAGISVGALSGVFQWPAARRFHRSFQRWPLKSVSLVSIGFIIARGLSFPIVQDAEYGFLFSFGFDLPPRWLPISVGLANHTLGGPVAGVIVGVTMAILQPLLVHARVQNWKRWLVVKSVPAMVAISLGTIPSLLGFDLLVIALVTGLAFALSDALLLGAQLQNLQHDQ